ncbi:TsaA-like domain-containing protein [Ochromonadaceae sp. CCMP2298]|nr:TsaA-like domain-containing protein [Ochromonadaceae sp. CCMP2298]
MVISLSTQLILQLLLLAAAWSPCRGLRRFSLSSPFALPQQERYTGEMSGRRGSRALFERRPRVKTSPDLRWQVRPIGIVESPYLEKFGVPKQATILAQAGNSTGGDGDIVINGLASGRIVLYPEFHECLTGLEGFDYVWAVTLMHLNSGFKTKIRPQPSADAETRTPQEVGLFASRAPHRPNPIALSALRVTGVNVTAGTIDVEGLDLLNDTPVLDLKPYIPAFDAFPEARAGWMDAIRGNATESRLRGYQSISSSRGARALRARTKELAGAGAGAGTGAVELTGAELPSQAPDLDHGSAAGLTAIEITAASVPAAAVPAATAVEAVSTAAAVTTASSLCEL